MLRTLIAGALVAIVGTKLKKAYDAGKLDPYIDRARAAAHEARESSATRRKSATKPAASQNTRSDLSDSPSKPAKAAPWPVDPRATPASG
jgi:hypothetical protein